ncbi:MAG: mechanosensitive ion channel, partial [Verrucomicrobiae bacterium]|nr:mechanosensitive ion channel [Verrucomicrobiae bacterium]
ARIALLAGCAIVSVVHAQEKPDAAAKDEAAVEVTAPAPDEKIRTRIEDVFSQVEEFADIDVRVRSGVVTLSGGVPNVKTRDEAMSLVRRTEGVVMTLDRMEEATEVRAQLSPAVRKLRDLGRGLVAKLPLIGIALLVVVLSALLANFLYRRDKWFARLRVSSLAEALARRLVRVGVIGVGVVLALEILDATAIVGAVLGAAGLVGIALGFAFKNILENYLSGILLSTCNPFDIGDTIEINGRTGKVALLTARDTVLVTLDGNHLRIPNSAVINSELLNFTRNPRRRFEFRAGVSVDLDLDEARRVGQAALAANPAVLDTPKPDVFVEELGDSTVQLRFVAWLDQRTHDFFKTKSQSIRMVKEAFDDAGIEMPEPIYRVRLRESGGGETHPPEKPSKPRRAAEEDLSADRTIDEQIAAERRQSSEINLLDESED